MKTKQIVFTQINTAELLDMDYSHPEADEVLVELEYSALSNGTEKANITGMRNGPKQAENTVPEFPRMLGYSASGRIVETGDEVNDLKVGDRVVVYWGKHKKHITVKRENVVKIPDEVSMQNAAMAFIATFPMAAIRKAKLEMGESAMVMGLGILGMFAVMELKVAGAYPVIAVDLAKERRDFALKIGADYALDPADVDFYDNVRKITDGGVNIVIEVTGVGAGLVQSLDCMRKFGRVSLLGCTRNSEFNIDYYTKVHGPGITIVGAHTEARPKESYPGYWTHTDDIKAVLNLIKGGRLAFDSMICEVHSPSDAPEVYNRLISDKNFPIGVLFDWRNI